MRRWSFSFVLFVAIWFVGCGNKTPTQPTVSGTLTIVSPVGGEIWKIGTEVKVSWKCENCIGLPFDDYIAVFASPDGVNVSKIIDKASITDEKTWVVGTTLQNVALLPGSYRLLVADSAGYISVPTAVFQITNP